MPNKMLVRSVCFGISFAFLGTVQLSDAAENSQNQNAYLLPVYRAVGLTSAQDSQIKDLIEQVDIASSSREQRIVGLQKDIAALLKDQNPNEKQIQIKQTAVNQLKDEIANAHSKLIIDLRSLLTSEQREKLLYGHLLAPYNKLILMREQKSKLQEILSKQVQTKQALQGKLANLETECRKFLLEPSLNEKVIEEHQQEINKLSSEIAHNDIDTIVAIRGILTDRQLKRAYPKAYPEQEFAAANPTKEQAEQIHTLAAAFDAHAREQVKKLFSLSTELSGLYSESPMPQDSILAKQQEINTIKNDISMAKTKLACQIRALFTPEQARVLFDPDPSAGFRQLNLTNAQKEEYRALLSKYKKDLQAKTASLFDSQLDYETAAADPRSSKLELVQKRDAANVIQDDINCMKRNYALSVRKILTHEQLDRLVIDAVLRNNALTGELSGDTLQQVASAVSKFRSDALDRSENINQVNNDLNLLSWDPVPNEKTVREKESKINAIESQNDAEKLKLMLQIRDVLKTVQHPESDVDVYDLTK